MSVWQETHKGGLIMRIGSNGWLARPFDRVGMNQIKGFKCAEDAIKYANGKSH